MNSQSFSASQVLGLKTQTYQNTNLILGQLSEPKYPAKKERQKETKKEEKRGRRNRKIKEEEKRKKEGEERQTDRQNIKGVLQGMVVGHTFSPSYSGNKLSLEINMNIFIRATYIHCPQQLGRHYKSQG